eukprot:scpid114780/ scgid17366/ 
MRASRIAPPISYIVYLKKEAGLLFQCSGYLLDDRPAGTGLVGQVITRPTCLRPTHVSYCGASEVLCTLGHVHPRSCAPSVMCTLGHVHPRSCAPSVMCTLG